MVVMDDVVFWKGIDEMEVKDEKWMRNGVVLR